MKVTRKCEHCGKEFTTASAMKKYCCARCAADAKAARVKKQQDFYRAVEPIVDMRQQEYLTFSKAAVLMGCSRQYVYKLVDLGKLKASRLSSRMAFIRRADIEAMLDASPYNKVVYGNHPKKHKVSKGVDTTNLLPMEVATTKVPMQTGCTDEPLTYISGEDIINRYKVKQSWLYTTAKRNLIPMCRISGKNYYSKKHVEDCLGVSDEVAAITDWLTMEEAGERYGIKPQSVHCYVYRHGIPTKREYGKVLYSKKHFDELMRPDLMNDERYMTVEQIKSEYGVQPANMHHIAKTYGLQKLKVGVKNLYMREDIERVMNDRGARGL